MFVLLSDGPAGVLVAGVYRDHPPVSALLMEVAADPDADLAALVDEGAAHTEADPQGRINRIEAAGGEVAAWVVESAVVD